MQLQFQCRLQMLARFVIASCIWLCVSPALAEEGKRVGSIIGLDKAHSFVCKKKTDYTVVAWAHERLKSLPATEVEEADKMSKKTYRDMTKSLGKLSTYREGSFQANMVKFLCRTIDSVLAKAERKHLSQQ